MSVLGKYLDCISYQRLVSCFKVVILQVQVGSHRFLFLEDKMSGGLFSLKSGLVSSFPLVRI